MILCKLDKEGKKGEKSGRKRRRGNDDKEVEKGEDALRVEDEGDEDALKTSLRSCDAA